MPANPTQDVRLDDVHLTPAMETLQHLATLSRHLETLTDHIGTLLTDAQEIAFAEQQSPLDIVRIQGRPDTWRGQMYKKLKRDRGIDPSQNRRPRKVDTPWDLPGYLNTADLQTLAHQLRRATKKTSAIMAQREQQYPDLHSRTTAAIDQLPAAS